MKETTGKFFIKANRALAVAARLLEGGDADFAAGRAYYAMFYVAGALLHEKDLRFRKHGGLHSVFGQHFIRTGELDPKYYRWLLAAYNKRIVGDYGIEAEISHGEVEYMIVQAREFLHAVQRYLGEVP